MPWENVELNDITAAVVEAAIRIHRGLGPGVFESVYETVLCAVLERRGLHVERSERSSFLATPQSYRPPANRAFISGSQFGTITS